MQTETTKLISNNLKQARIKAPFTQEEVSKILNIKRQTLSNYETGKREADYKTLKELINLYDISADWLFNTNPKRK